MAFVECLQPTLCLPLLLQINVNMHPEVRRGGARGGLAVQHLLHSHTLLATLLTSASCTQLQGKYSFVEFRAPEMATAALALSGQVSSLHNGFQGARHMCCICGHACEGLDWAGSCPRQSGDTSPPLSPNSFGSPIVTVAIMYTWPVLCMCAGPAARVQSECCAPLRLCGPLQGPQCQPSSQCSAGSIQAWRHGGETAKNKLSFRLLPCPCLGSNAMQTTINCLFC